MGALDEAGDVGDHERALAGQPDHAEVRHQRRERVVGDLGARAEMRAMSVDLPTFGKPSRPTSASSLSSRRRCAPRRASRARRVRGARSVERGEVDVAAAALAALRDDEALAVRREIGEELAGRRRRTPGAERDAQHDVLAAAPYWSLFAPASPRGRLVLAAGSGSRAASTAPRRRRARRCRRRRRRRPRGRPWGRTSRAGTRPRRCRRRRPCTRIVASSMNCMGSVPRGRPSGRSARRRGYGRRRTMLAIVREPELARTSPRRR